MIERAKGCDITDLISLRDAEEDLKRIAGIAKGIKAAFDPLCQSTDKAHKDAVALRDRALELPGQARRIYEGKILTFRQAEEKRRREAQAKLQEELRRQEEDRRLAEAAALHDTGHAAEADALLDAPIIVAPIELPKPESVGVSTRRRWTFRIINAASVKPEFLIPDEKRIAALVRALGPDAEKTVGGIVVEQEQIVAVRA